MEVGVVLGVEVGEEGSCCVTAPLFLSPAPAPASARRMPRPMPWAEPVTNAVLPERYRRAIFRGVRARGPTKREGREKEKKEWGRPIALARPLSPSKARCVACAQSAQLSAPVAPPSSRDSAHDATRCLHAVPRLDPAVSVWVAHRTRRPHAVRWQAAPPAASGDWRAFCGWMVVT